MQHIPTTVPTGLISGNAAIMKTMVCGASFTSVTPTALFAATLSLPVPSDTINLSQRNNTIMKRGRVREGERERGRERERENKYS